MEEILQKMNMIRKHNELVRLRRKNFLQDKKINQIKDSFDDIKSTTNDMINQMNEKIYQLEKENDELKRQRDAYIEYVEGFPKIIRKLFGPKKYLKEGK